MNFLIINDFRINVESLSGFSNDTYPPRKKLLYRFEWRVVDAKGNCLLTGVSDIFAEAPIALVDPDGVLDLKIEFHNYAKNTWVEVKDMFLDYMIYGNH